MVRSNRVHANAPKIPFSTAAICVLRFALVAVVVIPVLGLPYTFLFETTNYTLTVLLAVLACGATCFAVSFGRITHPRGALVAGVSIALGIAITGYVSFARVSQWNFDLDVAEEYTRRQSQDAALTLKDVRREMIERRFGAGSTGGFWDHILYFANNAVIDWKMPSSKPHRNILFSDYRGGADIWLAWTVQLAMFVLGCLYGAQTGAEQARQKQSGEKHPDAAPRRVRQESFADSARSRYGPDPTQMLRFAIRQGNRRLFDLALQDGASPLRPLDEGENPVHYAAAFHNDALGWLLEVTTSVDEPDPWGRRPLHIAAALGQAENVRKLLDAGADASSRNNQGQTPLHDAARNSRNERARNVMALLIEHGADSSAEDKNGVTPLMCAAFARQVSAVKWLIEHGARLDTVDRVKNWSVLGHAARGGTVAVLEYFLVLEPDALHILNRGGGVVEAAVEGLSAEALEFLLRRGAEADKVRLQEILDIMEYDHPVKEAQECRAVLKRYLPG